MSAALDGDDDELLREVDAALDPCHLCFRDAPAATVATCRVEVDPEGLEDALLDRLDDEDETLVAFALSL